MGGFTTIGGLWSQSDTAFACFAPCINWRLHRLRGFRSLFWPSCPGFAPWRVSAWPYGPTCDRTRGAIAVADSRHERRGSGAPHAGTGSIAEARRRAGDRLFRRYGTEAGRAPQRDHPLSRGLPNGIRHELRPGCNATLAPRYSRPQSSRDCMVVAGGGTGPDDSELRLPSRTLASFSMPRLEQA